MPEPSIVETARRLVAEYDALCAIMDKAEENREPGGKLELPFGYDQRARQWYHDIHNASIHMARYIAALPAPDGSGGT